MKRMAVALGALMVLAACEAEVDAAARSPGREPYALTILAGDERGEEQRVMLIEANDGRAAAVMIEGGASVLLSEDEAKGLLSEAALSPTPAEAANGSQQAERFELRLPGLSISASSSETGEDQARVSVGFGASRVEIDARDADGTARAVVRIAGADADDARKFIEEQAEITPETRAELYERLGL